jgi:hypothetical protein
VYNPLKVQIKTLSGSYENNDTSEEKYVEPSAGNTTCIITDNADLIRDAGHPQVRRIAACSSLQSSGGKYD